MEKLIKWKSDEVNIDIYTIVISATGELSVSLVVEIDESKTRLYNFTLDKLVPNTKFSSTLSNSFITNHILAHPDKLYSLAKDFEYQYENKLTEISSKTRKAIFVYNNKAIAHQFYKNVIDHLGTRSSRFELFEPFIPSSPKTKTPIITDRGFILSYKSRLKLRRHLCLFYFPLLITISRNHMILTLVR